MTVPAYTAPATDSPANLADGLARLTALSQCTSIEYDYQLARVDNSGAVQEDLTPYLVRDANAGAEIDRDCTATLPGSLTGIVLSGRELIWGSDLITPYQIIRSPQYAGGLWQKFQLGVYVATSGPIDLTRPELRVVTAYDKLYLLQSQPNDTLSFAAATTYASALQAIMRASGIIGGTAFLSAICDSPGAWLTKTLANPATYPLDGTMTYLDIINDLLKASGCIPLYSQPNGRFLVALTPVTATASIGWRWAGTSGTTAPSTYPDAKMVNYANRGIERDVFGIANQWAFIQNGLTFAPTHTDGSDGMYVVNNTTVPPSDQVSTGRIIRSNVFLDASGSADLITQGDALVAAQYAAAEVLTLSTAPWPIAWHYDIFQYTDSGMPVNPTRKVQAQSWRMPLGGGVMTWTANAVATL